MNYKVTLIKPFGALIEPVENDTSITAIEINNLKKLFKQNQILILRGFDTFNNSEAFANYCDSWGEVSLWPFGKVLELIEHENPQDHIFDSSYVPMHWDGMYRPQIPEYQIFHCVKAPLTGQGGRTTFSNTVLALENISPELKQLFGKVTGVYQRKMEFYNSKTISPIIVKHPFKDVEVIRYNEPPSEDKGRFINPADLEFLGVSPEEQENFHQRLNEVLYSPDYFYAHEWQEGDVVIADNFSLLHGREAFVSKSPRHIQRVHVLSDIPFDNPGLEFHE